MFDIESLWLILVSMLWGFTNPLMKKASVGIENVNASSKIGQFIAEVKFLAGNWRYLTAFVINQIGSVLFYWALGHQDLSTVVIVSNSLTLLFTTLASQLMGERRETKTTTAGMALVILGTTVCLWAKNK